MPVVTPRRRGLPLALTAPGAPRHATRGDRWERATHRQGGGAQRAPLLQYIRRGCAGGTWQGSQRRALVRMGGGERAWRAQARRAAPGQQQHEEGVWCPLLPQKRTKQITGVEACAGSTEGQGEGCITIYGWHTDQKGSRPVGIAVQRARPGGGGRSAPFAARRTP
ncbi:MAG: hypothetical protein J3K34DRAFT_201862 [Monoraphidium minutum]|nr:MAG: hypothetical protein J3K34DRAFT_201862 [Monoraphidium minutum]